MQRKKNLRLVIILAVLVVAGTVLALTTPEKNQLDIDRGQFTYDPASIDQVILEPGNGKTNSLAFVNGQWMLNDSLKADPQRVSVLFAILSQAQVRRKAPASEMEKLREHFADDGVKVTFIEQGQTVKEFDVVGDEERGITYYRGAGSDIFLMEIPGYRSYLAGIYTLDANGWRYPRIFDFNWRNLKRVDVAYTNSTRNFGVSSVNGLYSVENISRTDTTRLTDFLDNLSLLYVNDFISSEEFDESGYDSLANDLRAQVIVTDVGNNAYQMDILGTTPGKSEMLIRIDSTDYALASFDLLNKVMKPREYFIQKAGSE